jgi:hypothetical protein
MIMSEYFRSRCRVSAATPHLVQGTWVQCLDHDPMRYALILACPAATGVIYSLGEGVAAAMQFRMSAGSASIKLLREEFGDLVILPVWAATVDTSSDAAVTAMSYDPHRFAQLEAFINEQLSQ